MAKNENLHKAKTTKNDEFYTQLSDIENELKHYKQHFKDKIVFCNCDDPFESNFFKYFAMNFNYLGLKKLICTCYATSPIMYTQLSLFGEERNAEAVDGKKPYKIEITEVPDSNGDGAIDITDVEYLIRNDKNVLTILKGNGDFRSDECIELLNEADIVVTNPPFSLFREYIKCLVEHNKDFLVIGNQTAVSNKEIFPLIKNGKLWWGVSDCIRWFIIPDYVDMKHKYNSKGERIAEGARSRWWTNLDHKKRHEKLILWKKYTPEEYPTYDNYDAIEVSKTEMIPCDYYGVMGVPVTFLDKYSPDQFEILGCTQRGCHDLVPDTKKYDDYWEMKQDGTKTGSGGGKTNENGNLEMNDGKHNYFINDNGHIVQSTYSRIFIRRKESES